jgi:hypothetical protein
MCQKVIKGAERDKAEGFKAKVEAKVKARSQRLEGGGQISLSGEIWDFELFRVTVGCKV